MKAKKLSIVFVSIIVYTTIFSSCSPPNSITKVTFLEKIVINNEDTTDLFPKFKGEAHGGKYFSHTDSVYKYGIGSRFIIPDSLVNSEIKIKLNIWARQGNLGGANQFAVALQKGDSILNWDAVKFEKHIKESNKWINVIDSITFPAYLIKEKGLNIKMFSFNPDGNPYLDTDDIEIVIEKSEQVIIE